MYFAAIFATAVAGVAGLSFGNLGEDRPSEVDNFLKIRPTGKELLEMCVWASYDAFEERQKQLFAEKIPKQIPEKFLREIGEKPYGYNTGLIYSQCLNFIQNEIKEKVPVANRGAFDKRYNQIVDLAYDTSNIYWNAMPKGNDIHKAGTVLLAWKSFPTLEDIAYPNPAVYKKVLNPRITAKLMKAILVLGAANEVSKREKFDSPLAMSVTAMAEFLDEKDAPASPAEDEFHPGAVSATYIHATCIFAMQRAIEEATGFRGDEKVKQEFEDCVTKYHNKFTVEGGDQREFNKNMFNNCFNLSNELYDSAFFTVEQREKISVLQAKLITKSHPNVNLWKSTPDATVIRLANNLKDFKEYIGEGLTEATMKAKLCLQATRAAATAEPRGNTFENPVSVLAKITKKMDFLNRRAPYLR